MKFQIEVVQVSEAKGKTNARGGKFNSAELVYKRDGKVEAKSFPDWANKDIYPSILACQSGQIKTVDVGNEKVNGYWQWQSISDSDISNDGNVVPQQADQRPAQAASRPTTTSTGKVTGSNYETPQERAFKQRCIVAQSSIGSAIAFLGLQNPKGNADLTVDAVLAVADPIYANVMKKAAGDLSDIESDPV